MLVTDAQILEYWDVCASLARPLVGRAGAELEDLQQVGLIYVWQMLAKGEVPEEYHIAARMKDWVRVLSRQKRGDMIAYELQRERSDEAELPA